MSQSPPNSSKAPNPSPSSTPRATCCRQSCSRASLTPTSITCWSTPGPSRRWATSSIRVVPGNKTFPTDLKVSGTTIENANLRVTVDPSTGCITSLFNKKANFETLAPNSCGNELQAFKDTPKEYDAWNIDPGTLDQPPTLLHQVDSVKVVESGPMRAGIQVARTWQSSKFVQEISLDAGADEVLITNDIDWHETHVLLKDAFPLAATSDDATYEIPYGTIQRPTTRNNSWEKAKFEVPAMRWADLGDAKQGMSLINETKYGYDAAGNVLRLSLAALARLARPRRRPRTLITSSSHSTPTPATGSRRSASATAMSSTTS